MLLLVQREFKKLVQPKHGKIVHRYHHHYHHPKKFPTTTTTLDNERKESKSSSFKPTMKKEGLSRYNHLEPDQVEQRQQQQQ